MKDFIGIVSGNVENKINKCNKDRLQVEKENQENEILEVNNVKKDSGKRTKRKAFLNAIHLHKKNIDAATKKYASCRRIIPKKIKSYEFVGIKNKRKLPKLNPLDSHNNKNEIEIHDEIPVDLLFKENIDYISSDISSSYTCENSAQKEYRKLCKKNTKANEGYKNISIEYKTILVKKGDYEKKESKKVFCERKTNKKTRFLEKETKHLPHNENLECVKPIQKDFRDFSMKEISKGQKTIIYKILNVESNDYFLNFDCFEEEY
ncbi:hypothetical protein EHP00_409 [Ecytonucleospora hepatopenaei]|uniref:Uncharacterized protein n=1 Tax=Ecytonucleospora hepatopenaei TaxID=646526 RepID=A0A1W0E9K9_9MICR|nr:hypothetical protein EHP00_409 [Ecytonucleospora hepatopenaei]